MEPLHTFEISVTSLTLAAPSILESCSKTKISLNCYFHTSLPHSKGFTKAFKASKIIMEATRLSTAVLLKENP